LFQGEVNFLGFKVTGNTVRTHETKTASACITSWQFRKNITEFRSLIGLLSYNRGFLKSCAARIEPLSEMLRKDVPIVTTERRLREFDGVKHALTCSPVLGIFRSDCDIIIDVDTISTSCGAVCSQVQVDIIQVLEYASRCL